jgi:hypothetical protein
VRAKGWGTWYQLISRMGLRTSGLCSDLSRATIDKQFATGDEAALIRRQEGYSFCDFFRLTHSSHWHHRQQGAFELIIHLFGWAKAVEAGCADRTGANDVDTNVLQRKR